MFFNFYVFMQKLLLFTFIISVDKKLQKIFNSTKLHFICSSVVVSLKGFLISSGLMNVVDFNLAVILSGSNSLSAWYSAESSIYILDYLVFWVRFKHKWRNWWCFIHISIWAWSSHVGFLLMMKVFFALVSGIFYSVWDTSISRVSSHGTCHSYALSILHIM